MDPNLYNVEAVRDKIKREINEIERRFEILKGISVHYDIPVSVPLPDRTSIHVVTKAELEDNIEIHERFKVRPPEEKVGDWVSSSASAHTTC